MRTDYDKRILRVLAYVHENPGADLSLDRLADVAAMSRFHWHRVFQAMTGETCAQAVRRVRLHRAASWLIHHDWPIAEIAARVGYPNVQSFSRAFSDGFGLTPGAFRKQGRLGPPPRQTTKGMFRMYDVDVSEMTARRMAAMMHKGPYIGVGKCYEALSGIATAKGLWPQVQGMIGIYYDDPNVVAEADLRAHAGLLLGEATAIPEELEEVTLGAGPHAVLSYKGPYETIMVAYDSLFGKWLPDSGHEPADAPSYELYLNSPEDTAPEDLLTDIHLPLRL